MTFNKIFIASLKRDGIRIRCVTREEKFAVANLLKSIGEEVADSTGAQVGYINMDYPYVLFSNGEWTGSRNPGGYYISVERFLVKALLSAEVTTVKLNDEYSAVFNPGSDFVQVGCQKIPISQIKELAKVIESN